jgi:hypothetical protein
MVCQAAYLRFKTYWLTPLPVDLSKTLGVDGNSGAPNDNLHERYEANPSLFAADMQDFDVFEFFDSNFDLGEIDACLGGNLDLSFHINTQ